MGLFTKEEEKELQEKPYHSENEDQLRHIIEESVDASVNRAFKKYGKRSIRGFRISKLLVFIIIIAFAVGGFQWWKSQHDVKVTQLDDHDLTLENNGLLGYTAVDFEEVILGEATRQKLLIVEEQEASVNTTTTEAGFLNLSIFSKEQMVTIHGTGQYTINLSQIVSGDITLNEDSYELTIKIPHAELHSTTFDPSKTEVGDTKKGWLAFGDIKLSAEENKEFEEKAVTELQEKLSEEERFEEADRFAKLSAYETYQPLVSNISTAYKVVIDFQE